MKKRALILLAMAAGVVLIDQLIKYFATTALAHRGVVYLIDSRVFSLYFNWSLNDKMAFSLPSALWLIIVGTILILAGLGWWLFRKLKANEPGVIPLTLLMAAAASNLYDRIALSGVVDYISFAVGPVHFAIFNLADVIITGSIVVLLLTQRKTMKNIHVNAMNNEES